MGSAVSTIRRFESADVTEAVALEAANQPKPWTEGVFRDELAAENRSYFVAEDRGLIGFAGVMVIGEKAHVTNLLVDPAARGQGVGRRLMMALIESAIAEGARHLTLEVRSKNEAARALYQGLGLVPVGVRPGYFDNDDALILWAHDIDAPGFVESLR